MTKKEKRTEEKNFITADYLIIGSGIAGLRAAIELSNSGQKVVLVTKTEIEHSNTFYAQGGAAAVDPSRVEDEKDSFESHAQDTLKAGAGLCNAEVVERFSEKAHAGIEFLINQGVEFTENPDDEYPYELHQEGGHAKPRIYCVGDFTGKAIEETLAKVVRADLNINILEYHTAINLITKKWLDKDQNEDVNIL